MLSTNVHFSVPCSIYRQVGNHPSGLYKVFIGNCHWEWRRHEGGTTVGMLRVMSRRGDDRVAWDGQKLLAGDPEAIAAVREAERIFAQERAKGATAFRVEPGKPSQRIEQFDATAEQIVLVPRVVGG
jgi:hypothetical protein